jgi:hypothetical protein
MYADIRGLCHSTGTNEDNQDLQPGTAWNPAKYKTEYIIVV